MIYPYLFRPKPPAPFRIEADFPAWEEAVLHPTNLKSGHEIKLQISTQLTGQKFIESFKQFVPKSHKIHQNEFANPVDRQRVIARWDRSFAPFLSTTLLDVEGDEIRARLHHGHFELVWTRDGPEIRKYEAVRPRRCSSSPAKLEQTIPLVLHSKNSTSLILQTTKEYGLVKVFTIISINGTVSTSLIPDVTMSLLGGQEEPEVVWDRPILLKSEPHQILASRPRMDVLPAEIALGLRQ